MFNCVKTRIIAPLIVICAFATTLNAAVYLYEEISLSGTSSVKYGTTTTTTDKTFEAYEFVEAQYIFNGTGATMVWRCDPGVGTPTVSSNRTESGEGFKLKNIKDIRRVRFRIAEDSASTTGTVSVNYSVSQRDDN